MLLRLAAASSSAWLACCSARLLPPPTTSRASPSSRAKSGRCWCNTPTSAIRRARARRDLDQFILAKLEAAGLRPSADAEPATLLRRLHFDLVGLPPAPEAVRHFLERNKRDGLDAALAAEVDALLASPHFGERWGRH